MSFTVQYRSDSHELVRVYRDDEQLEELDGHDTKTFDGTVDGLTWNAETLDFAPTPSEPTNVIDPPDLQAMQDVLDTLVADFLNRTEG